MNRNRRMIGWPMTATRCAWLGGGSHPSGNATPKRRTSAGMNSAASTPPALKSSHRNGSSGRLAMLGTENQPGHQRGCHGPGRVVGCRDQAPRQSLATKVSHDRPRRQVEPGDGVEDDEEQGNQVEKQDSRLSRPFQKPHVRRSTLCHRTNQAEQIHDEPRNEDAAQFAPDERQVGSASQPPIGGYSGSKPPRMALGVELTHRPAHGRKKLSSASTAVLSL